MTTVERITQELDRRTQSLSVDQLLSEIHITVERISFASESGNIAELTKNDIDLLFEEQLSPEVLGFVYWLYDNQLIVALIGKTGRLFLNFCIKRYRHVQQVRFMTALTLPLEVRTHIAQTIMPAYPAGARILFETDPALVAGFKLDDSVRVVDKTMRTAISKLSHQRMTEVLRG